MNKLILKKIGIHFSFWFVYLWLWSSRDYFFYPSFVSHLVSNSMVMLSFLGVIYFNMYYLIPRFLLAKKYGKYVTLLFLLTLVNIPVITYPLVGLLLQDPFYVTQQGLLVLMTDIASLLILSTTLKFLKLLYTQEKYTQKLEKQTLELGQKNLETELSLLKTQIHPHFLFNTLNSIYFLIKKDPELSQEVVLQFSDMLSHQLYDTNKHEVPLSKEIKYLKNYCELEKIRQGDLVQLDFEATGKLEQPIAPMLLLPLVENAFKHGKGKADGYWIKIKVKANDFQLKASVENSYDPKVRPFTLVKENQEDAQGTHQKSGIGLVNVQRRLELMYPENHQLTIERDQEVFKVQLDIQLNSENVINSPV